MEVSRRNTKRTTRAFFIHYRYIRVWRLGKCYKKCGCMNLYFTWRGIKHGEAIAHWGKKCRHQNILAHVVIDNTIGVIHGGHCAWHEDDALQGGNAQMSIAFKKKGIRQQWKMSLMPLESSLESSLQTYQRWVSSFGDLRYKKASDFYSDWFNHFKT